MHGKKTAAAPPLAPSLLSVTPGENENDLSWTDNSDDEIEFAIFRGTDGVAFVEIDTVAADETTYNDPSLTNGQIYYYYVKARNANGDSDASNTANGTPASSLSTGLIEFYKLADTSGVNGNTLTVVGSVPFVGTTATFTANGANRLTRATQTWGTGVNSTLAVRFNPTNLASDQTVCVIGTNQGTPTGDSISINMGPTGQYIYVVGTTGAASGEKQWGALAGTQLNIVAGVLTQIVITISGGTVLVYSQAVDVTAGLTKIKDTALTMGDISRPIYIGQTNFGGGAPAQPFNGSVHSWGLWNRALTPAEVTKLYNSGVDLEHPF